MSFLNTTKNMDVFVLAAIELDGFRACVLPSHLWLAVLLSVLFSKQSYLYLIHLCAARWPPGTWVSGLPMGQTWLVNYVWKSLIVVQNQGLGFPWPLS